MGGSKKWNNRLAQLDEKTCPICKSLHGKIYAISEVVSPPCPSHPFCRCVIEKLKTVLAGHATKDNIKGIDWYLKYYGRIPDNYISVDLAIEYGWDRKKGNLSDVAPGMNIFGGIYRNRDGKLPSKNGRVWYEADINYDGGYRGIERIVFSNDGLIFVTYDHYKTFIEVE